MNGKCYLIFTFLIIKITTSSVACSFINHRSYFYFDCDQRIAAVQLNDLVVKECPELGIAEHVEEKSVAGDPYFVVEKLVLVRLELAPELEQLVPVPALVHEQLELAPVLGQLVLAAFVVDFEAVVAGADSFNFIDSIGFMRDVLDTYKILKQSDIKTALNLFLAKPREVNHA
jgi:hypothetical protein